VKHIWKILKFTSELRGYYIAVSFFSVTIAIMGLITPLLSGRAIDELRLGTDANITKLVWLAFGIFALDFGSTIISNFGGYLGDRVSSKLQKILSVKYYDHLLSLPQQFFDKELSGKIINRLNRSISQISGFVQMWSNTFLQFIFSTILALGVVAYFSWQIALLLFALYPIYIFMTIKTSGKWMRYAKRINKQWDEATGRFAEAIGQIKVVKSFVQERHELSFLSKRYSTMIKIAKPQSILWHKRDAQRRLILNVIFFGVYLLIFIQTANGVYSVGQAVTLILYAMQIRIPIFTISFLVENTQRAVADSKDYFEILDTKPAIVDIPTAKPISINKGLIEFKNVFFNYEDKAVIKGMSFIAKPDSKLALVGESGEGKSTIVNLIMRLYEVNKGKVLIDNQDISLVTQQSLRKQIGVVFQEPALFSGTIKENIAYANTNASEEEIINAAKSANAHEFISKLKDKYSSEIGEKGLKLSGGQKQRIAIARALLKNAPILVLDEATSSLDSKSELLVQEALERLMRGRTTIIIAHRLSTISNVDQIITLKGGSIDEVGSPAQLAKSGGIYSKLLNLQKGKTESAKKKLQEYEISS
jgi:ATP-binding cassette subfamily B protein